MYSKTSFEFINNGATLRSTSKNTHIIIEQDLATGIVRVGRRR